MSWERDPLWAKAKLFFERAFSEPREEPLFGLWCSLGLELLGRAALASVSPTLLADPRDHNNLLYALNRYLGGTPRNSIASRQVFVLCKTLFPQFYNEEDYTISIALLNRRNEELHTGGAAFQEYTATKWLAGFYKACNSLCCSMDETLVSIFGEEEAHVAEEIITENKKEVFHRVSEAIATHRKRFESKPEPEREEARIQSNKRGNELSLKRHHCVTCPACGCTATKQGTAFGKENISHEEDSIVVRQAVTPISFECQACGLNLSGYAELEAANLGGQYTRTTTYTPEEYYGLVNEKDTYEFDEDAALGHYPEYDNEQ